MSSATSADALQSRLRGQQSSLLGNRYELFCACRELLRLKGDEQFSLNSAEDFVIDGSDGSVHYQIKFSTAAPLTAELVRKAVKKWQLSFGGNRSARLVLVTNTALARSFDLRSSFSPQLCNRIRVSQKSNSFP